MLGSVSFLDTQYEVHVWNGQRLGMRVCIDTETTLTPFHITPSLVTMQAFAGKDVYYVPKDQIKRFFEINHDSTFILHNFSFDFDVLAKFLEGEEVFYKIIDEHRVLDTAILYRLYHLGKIGFVPPRYNLALLTEKFFNVELDKEGQTQWSPYLNSKLENIPQNLLEYGALDVIATYYLCGKLESLIKPLDSEGTLLSHDIQVKGEYALNRIFKNGIGFDLERRDEQLASMNKELDMEALILDLYGWRRGLKGMKDRYDSICEIYGINVPRTADGHRSSKREDLEKFAGNQFVDAYLKFHEIEKATTFIRGIESERVHPRYNSLVNTGRTSCSKPNFQQLPRVGGIREMFKARKDHSFIITDYSTLELATLAQVTYERYGYSVMRDKINAGEDLHKFTAANCLNKDVKDITKEERQKAKAINFGRPGGLGVDTLVVYAKSTYGVTLTRDGAQEWINTFMNSFPEMKEYLKSEDGSVMTLTGRLRGNTTYCNEKNTPFQGLAADGAKIALYNLQKAGFKIVGFVHDEVICEVPQEDAESMLKLQEKIMIESMNKVVPDVRISVETQVSRRYCK